jgi:hypothetical protein
VVLGNRDISSGLLLIILQYAQFVAVAGPSELLAKTVGEEEVVGARVLIPCCAAQVAPLSSPFVMRSRSTQPQLDLEQTVLEGHQLLLNSSTLVPMPSFDGLQN